VQNNLNGDGQKDDLFEYFDPRISPHMYPGGIQKSNGQPGLKASADEIKTMNEVVKRIGILLIDHGSKREASNDHLKQLAQAYQRHPKCPPHFIVGAAHMEIALPNIEQGIRNLILQDADQIICLPYFLSPGKHATEDVPRLIEEAKISIKLDTSVARHVEITLAKPLGSSIPILIDAISHLVDDTVKQMQPQTLGFGFFGDIMRMMEEEQNAPY